MNTLVIRLIVFACIFGGAIVGMLLGPLLPKDHLSSDSKDVVKMGTGLIGTMTAILLGLLVASAKNFYDAQATELTQQKATAAAPGRAEILYDKIQALAPQNEIQHSLQNQALSIAIDLGKTRWLMLEQATNSVSIPLVVALVFWLAVIFCSFGLFAPRNLTVVATLAICAISVSAAIFLVLEMYTPFGGLLPISDAPLRSALEHLGK
jgi:hypothetical protein